MVEFGQEQGLDIAKLLARSRLKEADLADPALELDASQELCVVGNLIRACRQPGLGLEVGMRYNFASYGLWGLGLVSSATAGDALALRQGAGKKVASDLGAVALQQGHATDGVEEHRKGPGAIGGLDVEEDGRVLNGQAQFEDEQAEYQLVQCL